MYIGGYPRPFKYYRASTLGEALNLLSELGEEGKVIAGGQSLMPMMRLRMSFLDKLIDIYRINELRYINVRDGLIQIGALTTHQEIAMSVDIAKAMPALTRAAWTIADLQVRNRGTIGGSLAHADPAANYLPPLMTMDAELLLASRDGRRKIKLMDFVVDSYTTNIKPNELIIEIDIPIKYNAFGYSILKRGGNAFPIVIAAVAGKISDGIIEELKLGVGGISSHPLLIEMSELRGTSVKEAEGKLQYIIESSIDESIKEARLLGDRHASEKYRIRAAKSYSIEAMRSALGGSK